MCEFNEIVDVKGGVFSPSIWLGDGGSVSMVRLTSSKLGRLVNQGFIRNSSGGCTFTFLELGFIANCCS